jgi:hypothetical protein
MFINSYSLFELQELSSVMLAAFESPQAFELFNTAGCYYLFSFLSKY